MPGGLFLTAGLIAACSSLAFALAAVLLRPRYKRGSGPGRHRPSQESLDLQAALMAIDRTRPFDRATVGSLD